MKIKPVAEALALAILVAAVLSPLVRAPLLFDDHSVVESDPAVRHVDETGHVEVNPFEDLWSQPRPLRQLSHRIDFLVFGDGMVGPHAENILLHLLAGITGLVLLRRLGLRAGTAWTAAALFLLNPVCVESVGILSHRKEILALLFLLLGLLLAVRRPERPSPSALACFLLAVCAKETAAIFPAFVALAFMAQADDCQLQGTSHWPRLTRPLLRTLAIYCAFAAAFAALAWIQIHHSMAARGGNPASDAFRAGHFGLGTSFAPALSAALRSVPRWAMAVAWPFGHSLDPNFDLRRPLLSSECLVAAVSVILFAIALVRTLRTGSRLFVPLAWCAAVLAPYLWPPFIQSGATQVLADRYAYGAAFGAAWLAALALESIQLSKARVAATAALLAIFGISSFSLARDYISEVSLWTRACTLNPWSFQAAHNRAMALWRENKDAKAAESEFARMTELEPNFDYGVCSRAQFRAEAGNPLSALALLDDALRSRPDSALLLRQRGIVRFGLGRMQAACADFSEAEKRGLGDSFFRLRYGEALIRTARWREARQQFLLAGNKPDARQEAEKSILLVSDPPLRRGGIIVAGDSLPHGTATVGEDGSEHGLVEFLSRDTGIPAGTFKDVSVPGSQARDLPSSIRKIARATPQPAICVIWCGHNDAFFGARPEDILQSLASAALECRKAGVRPVLVGPIPVRSAKDRDREGQERTLAKLNALMRDFCAEAGIAFADARKALYRAFPDDIGLAIDPETGNHLRWNGMKAVARAVSAAVRQVAR